MYHELLYHMDLCILAYHQYTQTLIWPFDPYYEQLALPGASRRDNFMAHIRNHFNGNTTYHGPGDTHGWGTNADLDPIIARYDRLHPWRPAFCRPEAKWVLYNIPTYITNNIASVRMCSYSNGGGDPNASMAPTTFSTPVLKPGGGGTDTLYCFEGGTGRISMTNSAWSLMGCILNRSKPGGGYDVHIAFRGSRSGSGPRAMLHGLVSKGNPDWVTDMDLTHMIQENYFSTYGSVCRGFSRAVKTSIPAIIDCLQHIHTARGGPPDTIYVTGHSLGGALATQFATAMVLGMTYGPNGKGVLMPVGLRGWPWNRLNLITYSAPVAGDKSFYKHFNSKIFCRRVVLSEDPITQDMRGYHVGAEVYITGENLINGSGVRTPLSYHEPINVRERLYRKAGQWGDNLANVPGPTKGDPHFPWKVYDSFAQMVQNQPLLTNAAVRASLGQLNTELADYMNILAATMTMNSSYKGGILPRTKTTRQNAITTAINRIGITNGLRGLEIPALVKTVVDLSEPFNDIGKQLGFTFLLAELVSNPNLTLAQLTGNPTLNACMQ